MNKLSFHMIFQILAIVTLVLALIITVEGIENRGLQTEVNDQRAVLQKGQAFTNVNNSLIQLIAKQAIDKNDEALKALLAANGITINAKSAVKPSDQESESTK